MRRKTEDAQSKRIKEEENEEGSRRSGRRVERLDVEEQCEEPVQEERSYSAGISHSTTRRMAVL